MNEQEVNKKWRAMIKSTTGKVKLFMKMKGLDQSKMEWTPKDNRWADKGDIDVSEEEKETIKAVSIEVTTLWEKSLSKFLKAHSEFEMGLISRPIKRLSGSWGSPEFSILKFSMFNSEFLKHCIEYSTDFLRLHLESSAIKFKYGANWIDFTKPSISANYNYNVSRTLVNIKTFKEFIKYITENVATNKNIVISRQNQRIESKMKHNSNSHLKRLQPLKDNGYEVNHSSYSDNFSICNKIDKKEIINISPNVKTITDGDEFGFKSEKDYKVNFNVSRRYRQIVTDDIDLILNITKDIDKANLILASTLKKYKLNSSV